MYRSGIAAAVLVAFSMFALSCSTPAETPLDALSELVPVPRLTPQEVVGIQLTAFRANDINDRGIALAYRFASPRNRMNTGTFENFASMLRSDPYAPMLGGNDFEIGPVLLRGELAMVAVHVNTGDGKGAGFIFVLTRQDGGSFHNCWMTDGVLEIGEDESGVPDIPVTGSA